MATPKLDQFLSLISDTLRNKDGRKLQDLLILEPPYAPAYQAVISELQQSFPKPRQSQLDKKCEALIVQEDGSNGGSWSAFINFLVSYLSFIRDVNISQLVDTHNQIKSLLK